MNEPERARRDPRDPNERDRTLARVRTTTAVTGVGAVLVGGVLVGWLGHEASRSSAPDPASSSTSDSGPASDSGSASGSDDGLSGPDSVPDSGSGSDSGQPGITSGGS